MVVVGVAVVAGDAAHCTEVLDACERMVAARPELDLLSATELIDLVAVAKAIGYPSASDALDAAVSPRGFRLLAKVPRLPVAVVDRLVVHFGSLQRLLGATVEDLQAVEGVGDARARGVREGLSRLAEASILERYV